jgi:CDP-glycerol glycerophosphotransferase
MPGPVVTDAAALGEVLADLPALRTEWAERYAAFRERFCDLDDGRASERVLQAFGPGVPVNA